MIKRIVITLFLCKYVKLIITIIIIVIHNHITKGVYIYIL